MRVTGVAADAVYRGVGRVDWIPGIGRGGSIQALCGCRIGRHRRVMFAARRRPGRRGAAIIMNILQRLFTVTGRETFNY